MARAVVAAICFAVALSSAGVAQELPCKVLELIEPGGRRYNHLVCRGVEDMERGAYEPAIRAFEEAASIRLPDVPNYRLFPRLALAYWRAGNPDRAAENLEKARLSLFVLIGVYRCQETTRGAVLVNPTGDVVEGRQVDDIRRRMCSVAYEPYYGYTTGPYDDEVLERLSGDAQLVENYLRIAKMIRPTGK